MPSIYHFMGPCMYGMVQQLMRAYFYVQGSIARAFGQRQHQRPVSHGMALIGHRGASARKPENTLAAIKQAWDDGADGAELDMHQLADGTLAVLHDSTLRRTADASSLTKRHLLDTDVKELKWEDVCNVEVGGHHVPRFEDVLQDIAQHYPSKICFAELKNASDYTVMAKDIAQAVIDAGVTTTQLVFISFNSQMLVATKRSLPSYNALLLQACVTESAALGALETAQAMGLDGINLLADPRVVTKALAEEAHGRGLLLAAWCLAHPGANDVEFVWSAMHANGVDMLTSNLATELLAWATRTNAAAGFQEYWQKERAHLAKCA